jgi:hypothetical protein
MFRHAWVVVGLLLCLGSTTAAKERVWTDSTGRTMRAEFVREIDGEVTFLKDGKIITLALDKLSARDQQIVRDLAAGKPVVEDLAPAAAPASPVASESNPSVSPPKEQLPAESPPAKPLTSKPLPIESRTWTDVFGIRSRAIRSDFWLQCCAAAWREIGHGQILRAQQRGSGIPARAANVPRAGRTDST